MALFLADCNSGETTESATDSTVSAIQNTDSSVSIFPSTDTVSGRNSNVIDSCQSVVIIHSKTTKSDNATRIMYPRENLESRAPKSTDA